MIILLSPAKTLDFSPIELKKHTQPAFLPQSKKLVGIMKKQSSSDLQKIMKVSEKIANLNVDRYKTFKTPFTSDNAKQALFAFKGDVYTGLEATSFSESEIEFAQKHVRILSGLYGLLKPLDLMQPYRLEMGTKMQFNGSKNLYHFWDKTITKQINKDLESEGSEVVLNLASNEYFHAVKKDTLSGNVINVHFKENRDGVLKVISFTAKKARGAMTNLIVKEGITSPEKLKELVVMDYIFDESLSNEENLYFIKN